MKNTGEKILNSTGGLQWYCEPFIIFVQCSRIARVRILKPFKCCYRFYTLKPMNENILKIREIEVSDIDRSHDINSANKVRRVEVEQKFEANNTKQ